MPSIATNRSRKGNQTFLTGNSYACIAALWSTSPLFFLLNKFKTGFCKMCFILKPETTSNKVSKDQNKDIKGNGSVSTAYKGTQMNVEIYGHFLIHQCSVMVI